MCHLAANLLPNTFLPFCIPFSPSLFVHPCISHRLVPHPPSCSSSVVFLRAFNHHCRPNADVCLCLSAFGIFKSNPFFFKYLWNYSCDVTKFECKTFAVFMLHPCFASRIFMFCLTHIYALPMCHVISTASGETGVSLSRGMCACI